MNGQGRCKASAKISVLFICLIYAFSGLGVLGWMSLRVDDSSKPVALIFPPGMTAHESFNRVVLANGQPLRYGARENIIIAHFFSLTAQQIKNQTKALILINPIGAGSCFREAEI